MDSQLFIAELKRFLDFIQRTRLSKADGISTCGHTAEEMAQYPPDAPGIHPYWDDEMEAVELSESLIHWAKTWTIPYRPQLNGRLMCQMEEQGQKGLVALSIGDWSLSSAKVRSGVVPIGKGPSGEPYKYTLAKIKQPVQAVRKKR